MAMPTYASLLSVNVTLFLHCMKSVCIRSYSGPYFPAFGLNMERFEASLSIPSECGKIRSRITPNTDKFYAVLRITDRSLTNIFYET